MNSAERRILGMLPAWSLEIPRPSEVAGAVARPARSLFPTRSWLGDGTQGTPANFHAGAVPANRWGCCRSDQIRTPHPGMAPRCSLRYLAGRRQGGQDVGLVLDQERQQIRRNSFLRPPPQLVASHFKVDSSAFQFTQNFRRGHNSDFSVVRLFLTAP